MCLLRPVTVTLLENCPWIIGLALPHTPRARVPKSLHFSSKQEQSVLITGSYRSVKAQLTINLSSAPLWDLDEEYSTQAFARDHNFTWLPTNSCLPPSSFTGFPWEYFLNHFHISLSWFVSREPN